MAIASRQARPLLAPASAPDFRPEGHLPLVVTGHLTFERAFTRLGPLLETGNVEKATEIFGIVGREALSENGDWLLLHCERPLESTILG